MIVVCRNAEKRFDKPILSALHKWILKNSFVHDIHCNGYSQIFIENLLPNQRFGGETVKCFTVSTNYNHYILSTFIKLLPAIVTVALL